MRYWKMTRGTKRARAGTYNMRSTHGNRRRTGEVSGKSRKKCSRTGQRKAEPAFTATFRKRAQAGRSTEEKKVLSPVTKRAKARARSEAGLFSGPSRSRTAPADRKMNPSPIETRGRKDPQPRP